MAGAPFAILSAALLLFSATVCINALPSSRILGGDEVESGDFTYVASVRLDSVHVCGGTIIGVRHILTAAHCVTSSKTITANRLSARVGSTNQFASGKIVSVSAVTAHPNYDYAYANDIAVLTLSSDLEWSSKISSVSIATIASDKPPEMGGVAVAGWGEQTSGESPYKLQSLNFIVASDAACTDAYSSADDSIICLAHELKQGSCTGDAGNGGIYNGKLVAVSNLVIGACGARYPDVFVSVVYYADWIQSVIA